MDVEYRDKLVGLVDNRLQELLAPRHPEKLYEAMAYSVFAGGKRLRPLLLIAAYEAASGVRIDKKNWFAGWVSAAGGHYANACALDFACAVEMIHCYSLIHDDLPAMDNDDFRRGKPTSHRVYGEAMALLAGDALLNTAYEVMSAQVLELSNVTMSRVAWPRSVENVSLAMQTVARAAGTGGMIGGQVVDMQSEGKQADDPCKSDAEVLSYIHRHKTGALLSASAVAGAYLGGASADVAERLSVAMDALGLAFQIKDDLLDITSTADELGKPVGSDAKNHKLTYPSVHGIEKSREDYDRLSREAVEGIRGLFYDGQFLTQLAETIAARNA